ncbi:6-phospho-beta-glucosidase [Orenia metallireducens]|uniref:6-phospho-beta-glucosidase n=1 Tax=Orenia metallireducens TaxID=1413210 RepID=A0A1C0ABK2_9FIRM|nr:glycoside hydrolase family 1 protein [Orenia metallireducens]OCL27714.1 6-phospho-beta-glucosidase [Orenia metallireducens]
MKYIFPEGFWWGAAVSALQVEGASDKRGETTWDRWFKLEPNRFFDGVGPKVTSDFYNRYEEDIELMKELNFNSFRTSISWARLFPKGFGEINQEGVDFYNNLIDKLIENNIEPVIALFHFDMPMAMMDLGGFESREVVNYYEEYAKICFELFGDRVKHWVTHNEPIVPVEGGYLYNFHYPDVVDCKRGIQVAYNTAISSAKVVNLYKEMRAEGKVREDGRIGIVLSLTPSYPRSNNSADLKAARIADLFFNKSFLDPCVKGAYPEELVSILADRNMLPVVEEGDKNLLKEGVVEFLGFNYYFPRRVKVRENAVNAKAPFLPEHLFEYYDMPGKRMNRYRGWEIYAKGTFDTLINIKDNYGNLPIFISENGMGVEDEARFRNKKGYIDDDYRINFVKEHLKWLHKAIEEGCNVNGYHMWTLMDNWSWMNAYKNRYGFIEVDLEDDLKRTMKKSGYWFKEVAQNNGFND